MFKKISYLVLFVCLFSCKNEKDPVKIKKTYYPTGEIKKIRKMLNDTTIIDTSYLFYKNGKIQSKEVHDSSGKLSGTAQYFWDNGGYLSSVNYINGLAQGESIAYDSLGNLYYKDFYFNDKEIGDYYTYKDNKVDSYVFFDFDSSVVTKIEYNNKGEIINNRRNGNMVYKVEIKKLPPADSSLVTINILQSNPLRNSNKLIVNYKDSKEKRLGCDSIIATGLHLISIKKKFTISRLIKIQLTDIQYDSIIKKKYEQSFKIVVLPKS